VGDLKTKKTKASVAQFIDALKDEQQREDAKTLLKMFSDITGEKPVMWGSAIIGYGNYHYKYASGREGDWMLVGFSPRKANLSLYIHPGNVNPKLLKQLGPNTPTMGCLYIKRLSDVDQKVLKQVIAEGIKGLKTMLYKKERRGPVEGKAARK
jgi:hypothetical protein